MRRMQCLILKERKLRSEFLMTRFLVVHCTDVKQMTVRLRKRLITGTDNALDDKIAETASSVRYRILSLRLKRVLSGITSDEIQSKLKLLEFRFTSRRTWALPFDRKCNSTVTSVCRAFGSRIRGVNIQV